MITISDLATKERIIVSTSPTKAGGLQDLYTEENWGNPPLIPHKSKSGILNQPVGRGYTQFGLESRLQDGTDAYIVDHPEAILFGGENGEFDLGTVPYDIGVLGVRPIREKVTSIAYTGSSQIMRWWSDWVHAEDNREFGFFIQKGAENIIGQSLLPQDIASLEKDPMGYRSLWSLTEYNRRRLYKYGFRAALAPLLNSPLYQQPPVFYKREDLLAKLAEVRAYVKSQQRVTPASIDNSRHLIVLASDNLIKYQGTLSALQKMHRRGIVGRLAYEHLLPNCPKSDFQLLSEDAEVFGPTQPTTPEEIISMGFDRAQQKRDKYSRALLVYGTQGGFVELGNVTYEAHFTPTLNQFGQRAGEWSVFFPLPNWFVWQVYEYRTQASHLAQVYGGLGSDPIQLFSQGMSYNRAETIEIASMGATLLHAYPEVHCPQPYSLFN